jgi:hypothetical protein
MNRVSVLNPPLSLIRPLTLKWTLPTRRPFILKMFWIFSLFSIIVLLIFYIFQISELVSEGYLLQNYQKKLSELTQKNEILEINLAQTNSLGNVEKQIHELGFEKIDKVYYIRVLESQIATK